MSESCGRIGQTLNKKQMDGNYYAAVKCKSPDRGVASVRGFLALN